MKGARENGKEIVAYTSGLGTTGYLLASQANELILERIPMVLFDHLGLAGLDNIKKISLKTLNVNMNVYAAGDFKSGPDIQEITC